MKKLLLVLACLVLTTVLFVGCIPGITPTPEPEEPAPVMEAVAIAELDENKEFILWSIINVGDVFIREYTLTFEVEYPDVAIEKDYVVIEVTGKYLEVGDIHSGDIKLVTYDSPESVSVTWELSE